MPAKDISTSTFPHSAISSWSGFVYQGKVALHHALTLLDGTNNNEDYSLQLDSLEDFAILDGSGTPISLHQVKALKAQNFSAYAGAFVKLWDNFVKYNCSNVKFHMAQEISDTLKVDINKAFPPVELYLYDGDGYCALDQIDNKIEQQLKRILAVYFSGDLSKQTDEYASKARGYLDQVVLKKILKIHQIVHDNLLSDREAAYTQSILFEEFCNVLQEDLNQKELGEDYYYYILLNDLYGYYQEYCVDHEEEITEEELRKLSLVMKDIGEYEKEDMINFIRKIIPQRKFKSETLKDYKDNSFDKDGIQLAFLSILRELREPNSGINWESSGNCYFPTTIDKGSSLDGAICKQIVENAENTDLDTMFEGGNLITTDINVDSIVEKVSRPVHFMNIEETETDRIVKWKKVSLICLNNAKGIIND